MSTSGIYIPPHVKSSKVTANAKILFGELNNLSKKKGYCYAGNRYLSEIFGVSERSVSGWIRALEKLSFIRVNYVVVSEDSEVQRRIFICHAGKKTDVTSGKKFPLIENKGKGTKKPPIVPLDEKEGAIAESYRNPETVTADEVPSEERGHYKARAGKYTKSHVTRSKNKQKTASIDQRAVASDPNHLKNTVIDTESILDGKFPTRTAQEIEQEFFLLNDATLSIPRRDSAALEELFALRGSEYVSACFELYKNVSHTSDFWVKVPIKLSTFIKHLSSWSITTARSGRKEINHNGDLGW